MSIDTDARRIRRETIGEPVTAARAPRGGTPQRRASPRALGAGASLVAVAYLARAAGGGGVLDWVLFVVLGADRRRQPGRAARRPHAAAGRRRPRRPAAAGPNLGRPAVGRACTRSSTGRGAAGGATGCWSCAPTTSQRVLEDLDPGARRTARVNRGCTRAPLAVPLGLSTRVVGAEPDLTTALRALADGRAPVVEPESAAETAPRSPRPRPAARDRARDRSRWPLASSARTADEAVEPVAKDDERRAGGRRQRDPRAGPRDRRGARAEVRHESRAEPRAAGGRSRRTPRSGASCTPPPRSRAPCSSTTTSSQPPPDPVLGPQFAAARDAARADRRPARRAHPHPPARDRGDRGRRLQRLRWRLLRARSPAHPGPGARGRRRRRSLATYDERYADAPIDPRRVFEAELAGAGSIRATRGGPNWSVLVAAVMALILCWSVARLVTGGPDQTPDQAALSGSGGPNHGHAAVAEPVPVTCQRGRRRGAGRGPRRHREAGLLRRPVLRTAAHRAGVPAGADPVHRRVGEGDGGRPGPRAHGASGPTDHPDLRRPPVRSTHPAAEAGPIGTGRHTRP